MPIPGQYEKYLELALSQANATQTYWDFYIFFVVAVLGFIATVRLEVLSKWHIKASVVLLFAVFALSNLLGMLKNHDRREVLIGIAHSEISDAKGQHGIEGIREICRESDVEEQKVRMLCSSIPPGIQSLLVFHLCFDIAVVFLVLFSSVLRRKLSIPKPTPESGGV